MTLHKNVPGWERGLRGLMALGLIAGGGWLALAGGQVVWGLISAAMGVGLGVTAVSGWCPMCAAVGRTLPKADRTVPIAKY